MGVWSRTGAVLAVLSACLTTTSLGNAVAFQTTARVDERALVRVPATEPWVDTGLIVSTGDVVTIKGWGTVVVSKSGGRRTSGPNGASSPAPACERLVSRDGVAPLSLVADVATSASLEGGGFAVGTKWTGKAPFEHATAQEGRLYLGVNHDSVSCDRSGYNSWALRNDSEGAFTAEVTVAHRR